MHICASKVTGSGFYFNTPVEVLLVAVEKEGESIEAAEDVLLETDGTYAADSLEGILSANALPGVVVPPTEAAARPSA